MAWSLRKKDGGELAPLQFSNGKTQEDVVNEIKDAIKEGCKVIFLHGMCGTGKSAIALNLAAEIGRASIVVPVKYLQSQYEVDYTEKFIVSRQERPLKIAMITGRGNHACKYNSAVRADDRLLPCSIELKSENIDLLRMYEKNNPLGDHREMKSVDEVRRISVAPACPYWSPIVPKEGFNHYVLPDATRHEYTGLKEKKFVFFHRKPGCSYYEQFMAYKDADVIIFNAKKYEVENMIGRKPLTEVEIVDEGDEFLDNLCRERKLNLSFLDWKLGVLIEQCRDRELREVLLELKVLTSSIVKSKWVDDFVKNEEVVKVEESRVYELLKVLLANEELLVYEDLEPFYFLAKSFEGLFDTTYTSFSRTEKESVVVSVVNINIERRLSELLEKNKVFVFMSGTLHSKKVLKEVFGLKEFRVIEAETGHQGTVGRARTGLEQDFRYKHFESGMVTREGYLKALDACVLAAKLPALVQVNSFSDLPSEEEKEKFSLSAMSREKLRELQDKYKKGELLEWFKEGKLKVLYSTKCNRGVDLPGEMCRSIVFTKYPFPSMSSLFWKVLREAKPEYFMDFYFDKARREFLQRVYRGVRSKDDTVEILSPDRKVVQAKLE